MSMGTPAFMPPEQALGRMSEVGPRSDLWSIGASLFVMLAGRNVHDAQTGQEMMVLVATKPPVSLATLVPGLSPEVVAVVDRALSFERDARFEGALEMQRAIADAHAAVFGEPISLSALAGVDAANAKTIKADEAPTPNLLGGPTDPSPPPMMQPVGNTTVQPISTEPKIPIARVASWPLFAVIGAVVIGIGGAVAWVSTRGPKETASVVQHESASGLVGSPATSSPPNNVAAPPAPTATESGVSAPAAVATPPTSTSSAPVRTKWRTPHAPGKPDASASASAPKPAPTDPLRP
jgi:eukaryotic-like serine/threonine-protein kinase